MNKQGNSKQIKKQLRELIPEATMEDFLAIENKANAKHLSHLPPSIAAWQAITSYVRHVYTDYDTLMDDGYEKDAARYFVKNKMETILVSWGCTKTLPSS